ncbi:hypothetical protein [Sphingomonas sp.]|uniref:hypothetical protein n=1 Tax=Sphingomonas sp. TaxID=28214 RepID=UPI003B3B5CFE
MSKDFCGKLRAAIDAAPAHMKAALEALFALYCQGEDGGVTTQSGGTTPPPTNPKPPKPGGG